MSLVLDPAGRMDPELLQTRGHTKFAHSHRYWLGHKRPEITAAVLRLGYDLLFCGSDIAFLSNPFEAILSSTPHPSDSDLLREQAGFNQGGGGHLLPERP